MTANDAKTKYDELFSDDAAKARAFDKIAELYYFANFGSTSKADFDTLMFSIYIEQILDKSQADFNTYSDYTLSKQLGITQSKVSSLKVKKELKYPYERFDWKESFARIANRIVYEDGKIKIHIPDRNLYYELKNAIETSGGFVEVQLTANLLQVRLSYFIDLLLLLDKDSTREETREMIKKTIKEADNDIELLEKEPFGKALLDETPEMIIDIIEKCVPVVGGVIGTIGKSILTAIKRSKK